MSYLAAAKGVFGGGMGGGAGPSTSSAESGGSIGGSQFDFGGIKNNEPSATGNAPIIIAAVAVTIFVVIGGVAIIRSK